MRPEEVMERVFRAWERGDYETLRELLHPDGTWTLTSARQLDRSFFQPGELVEAIRHAQEDTIYKLYSVNLQPLDDQVVLADAYIRAPFRDGGSGHRVGRRIFLCAVRDDLFFRREFFLDVEHAVAAFEAGWGSENVPLADEPARPEGRATPRVSHRATPGKSR